MKTRNSKKRKIKEVDVIETEARRDPEDLRQAIQDFNRAAEAPLEASPQCSKLSPATADRTTGTERVICLRSE